MFIDVGDGLSINVDSIEAVRSDGELSCLVYSRENAYKVGLPKSVILGMIESRGEKKMSAVSTLLSDLYKLNSTASSQRI